MKKIILSCMLLTVTAFATKAETFTTENLSVFEILSDADKTVSLVDINKTSSFYEMPDVVEHNGVSYNVVALGGDCTVNVEPRPALMKFTISKNVSEINGNFFKPYTQLSEIQVDKDNKSFIAEDGILYNFNKTAILNAPAKNTFFLSQSQTEYIVPDNIEEIGNCAFCNAPLYYITISSNVKKIGDYAFSNTKLRNIHIPYTVESIGKGLLSNCEDLTEVSFDKNSSLTAMPAQFLSGSMMIQKITLPEGVIAIGSEAFKGLKYLQKIDFATTDNGAEPAPAYTFLFPGNIHSIGDRAFMDCENIEEFVAPASLETIGSEAFANCESLKRAILSSGLKDFGSRVFHNDQNLNDISLPVDNANIQVEAGIWYDKAKTKLIWCSPDFMEAELLVPEGVTYIQDYAFEPYRMDYSHIFDHLTLPSSYTILTTNALAGCTIYNLSTSNSLQTIQDFAYNTRQSEILLPASVVKVDRWNLHNLESIALSAETIEISAGAFNLCENLTEINLPAQQPPILGQLAFYAMASDEGSTPDDFNPEFGTIHNPIYPIPEFQYRRKAYIYVPAESIESYLADKEWSYQTSPATCGPTGIVLRGISDGVNVYVSDTKLQLDINETFQLCSTIKITNSDEIISCEWESDNDAIASISMYGEVTAHAVGNGTIKFVATAKDGEKYSAECDVEVSDKSGVDEIHADNGSMPDGIYTLYGILVSTDLKNIDDMSGGVYIVISNGRARKIMK